MRKEREEENSFSSPVFSTPRIILCLSKEASVFLLFFPLNPQTPKYCLLFSPLSLSLSLNKDASLVQLHCGHLAFPCFQPRDGRDGTLINKRNKLFLKENIKRTLGYFYSPWILKEYPPHPANCDTRRINLSLAIQLVLCLILRPCWPMSLSESLRSQKSDRVIPTHPPHPGTRRPVLNH